MNKSSFSPAILLGLGAMFAPTAAHAQDAAAPADQGFYGSLKAGGQETENINFAVFGPAGSIFDAGEGGIILDAAEFDGDDVPAGSDSIIGKIGTKTGFAVAGSVGYDFGLIRAEVEASWLQAKISTFTVTGGTAGGTELDEDGVASACADSESDVCEAAFAGDFGGSKVRQLSGMANVWLDIPLGFHGVEPFVGGGVGFTNVRFTRGGGDDTVFAWQLGGGLAIPLGDRLKLTIDYRHRETKRPDLGESGDAGVLVGRIKSDAVVFGVRSYF